MSDDDELWKDLPLFAPDSSCVPKIAEGDTAEHLPEAIGALSHLLYDEETPQEIAENLRDQGNTLFKRGTKDFYKLAIQKYTEAIGVNCDMPDVIVPAFANRSAAHLKLKNYGKALQDAESALKFDSSHVKSRYRAALSAAAVGKHDIAVAHCDTGLDTLGRREQEKSHDAVLLRQVRKTSDVQRRKEAAAADEAERRRATAEAAECALSSALKRRRVTMGLPLFAQQRSYKRTKPCLEEQDGGDSLLWPLLVVYPDVAGTGVGEQSDYLEEVSEHATLDDVLTTLFPEGAAPPPWDVSGLYANRVELLSVQYRASWTMKASEADSDDEREFAGTNLGPEDVGRWKTVPRSLTLAELIRKPDYVVPLFPVLYVVPK